MLVADVMSSNRLRNIEMTEKAKRDMLEARKATVVKKRPEDEDFAAARCMCLGIYPRVYIQSSSLSFPACPPCGL